MVGMGLVSGTTSLHIHSSRVSQQGSSPKEASVASERASGSSSNFSSKSAGLQRCEVDNGRILQRGCAASERASDSASSKPAGLQPNEVDSWIFQEASAASESASDTVYSNPELARWAQLPLPQELRMTETG
eukprot:1162034-Pelagomonas_calceolata.AAC.6